MNKKKHAQMLLLNKSIMDIQLKIATFESLKKKTSVESIGLVSLIDRGHKLGFHRTDFSLSTEETQIFLNSINFEKLIKKLYSDLVKEKNKLLRMC